MAKDSKPRGTLSRERLFGERLLSFGKEEKSEEIVGYWDWKSNEEKLNNYSQRDFNMWIINKTILLIN